MLSIIIHRRTHMKHRFTPEIRSQLLPRIFVISFTLLLVALLYYFKSIWGVFSNFLSIITPFLCGFGISFLLSPVQNSINRVLLRLFFRKKKRARLMNGISGLLSLIFMVALITVFLSFVLPQLIRSITSIIGFISRTLKHNEAYINSILVKYNFLNIDGDSIVVAWDNIVSSQIGTLTSLLGNVLQISGSVVSALYTVLISMITAFYIMMDRSSIATRIKKTGYAMLKESTMGRLIYWTRRANHIFTGFISGKILDSLIIGAICYICMLIFGIQYPLLIACVIGVTNIIPFFGPFIGWFPCALILCMVKPINALWFTVFILVLQQIDGNVIGPHILGDYVGVSAFSIMIVIIIGSGLFGFAGMLLAVPVYALANAICKTYVEDRLIKKGLSTVTNDYLNAPETPPRYTEVYYSSNIPMEENENETDQSADS